mgnify:CR=1 FL=1
MHNFVKLLMKSKTHNYIQNHKMKTGENSLSRVPVDNALCPNALSSAVHLRFSPHGAQTVQRGRRWIWIAVLFLPGIDSNSTRTVRVVPAKIID